MIYIGVFIKGRVYQDSECPSLRYLCRGTCLVNVWLSVDCGGVWEELDKPIPQVNAIALLVPEVQAKTA